MSEFRASAQSEGDDQLGTSSNGCNLSHEEWTNALNHDLSSPRATCKTLACSTQTKRPQNPDVQEIEVPEEPGEQTMWWRFWGRMPLICTPRVRES